MKKYIKNFLLPRSTHDGKETYIGKVKMTPQQDQKEFQP